MRHGKMILGLLQNWFFKLDYSFPESAVMMADLLLKHSLIDARLGEQRVPALAGGVQCISRRMLMCVKSPYSRKTKYL